MQPQNITTIVYDFPTVNTFCRSVAFSVALQQLTEMRYHEQSTSDFVNAFYFLVRGDIPYAEIRQASKEKIAQTTDRLHAKFITEWINRLHRGGPPVGNEYIDRLTRLRENSRSAYETLCQDAAKINKQLADSAHDAQVLAARVRLAGTVGVTLIGLKASLALKGKQVLLYQGVNLAYSSSASVVKHWEDGFSCKAAAVGWESTKSLAGNVGEYVANRVAVDHLKQAATNANLVQQLKNQVANLSAELGQQGMCYMHRAQVGKDLQRTMHSIDGVQSAAHAAKMKGQGAQVVGKAASQGLPVIFAARDIWGAFGQYKEDIQ